MGCGNRKRQRSVRAQTDVSPNVGFDSHDTHDNGRDSDTPSQSTSGLQATPPQIHLSQI